MGKIYKYSELKGVLKVGDVVRAVKGKENCCIKLKSDGSNTVVITKIEDELFWINDCEHFFNDESGYLEIVSSSPRTIKDADVGDVVMNRLENYRKILGKDTTGNILHLSRTWLEPPLDDEDKIFSNSVSRYELDENFTLVLPEEKPKRVVTQAEINEKFGEEVEIKKD